MKKNVYLKKIFFFSISRICERGSVKEEKKEIERGRKKEIEREREKEKERKCVCV
jgi:hypothetical protein